MDFRDTDEVGNRRIKIVNRRLKKVIMLTEMFAVFASAGHGAGKRIENLGERKGGVGKMLSQDSFMFYPEKFFLAKTSLYFLFSRNFKERAAFLSDALFFLSAAFFSRPHRGGAAKKCWSRLILLKYRKKWKTKSAGIFYRR